MRVSNRKVSLFRCHIDPMIGPKSKLAFMLSDPELVGLKAQCKVNEEGNGLVVLIERNGKPELHVVGLPNVQSARLQLTDDEIKALKDDFSLETLENPKKVPKLKSQAV